MHKNAELALSKSYTKWMIAALPGGIATGALSTFIPLYMLALGGNALSVALAFAGYNAVAMLMNFVWGRLADMTGKRKVFIMISYIGVTVLLIMLYYARGIADVVAIYTAIALFSAANNTPYNLLVMETDTKENWSKGFSRFQAMSNVGMVIGLLLAAVVSQFTGLSIIVLMFATASFASAVFAAALVVEPMVSVRRVSTLVQINNIAFSMFSYPFRFINLKYLHRLRSMPIDVLAGIKKPFSLMCISWLIFNVGMSMVNTEYAASLNIHGLSQSTVFGIVLIAMLVQTVFFYYALKWLYRDRLYETTQAMMLLRAVSYILIGLSFLISAGLIFAAANLTLYTVVAGIAYPFYLTASYTILFKEIGDSKKGEALGIYNGVGWFGYFAGAILAGVFLILGFTELYAIAGLWIFVSMYIFGMVTSSPQQTKKQPVPLSSSA